MVWRNHNLMDNSSWQLPQEVGLYLRVVGCPMWRLTVSTDEFGSGAWNNLVSLSNLANYLIRFYSSEGFLETGFLTGSWKLSRKRTTSKGLIIWVFLPQVGIYELGGKNRLFPLKLTHTSSVRRQICFGNSTRERRCGSYIRKGLTSVIRPPDCRLEIAGNLCLSAPRTTDKQHVMI